MTSRRAVLQGAFGVAVSASVPHAFAAETIAVVPIGSKSALLTGAGGNVLACSTTDGLVVVDSGATAASAMLMDVLGGLADGARTNTLFNTHWHHDQIGGNGSIGETGATIIAHEKTRQRLAVGYYLPEEDRYEAPVPDKGLPSRSFYTTGASTIGGQRVEYGYLLEAHTDGDCYVYFRDTNVIAVGDAGTILRIRRQNGGFVAEGIPYDGFDHILSVHYRGNKELLIFGARGAQIFPFDP